MYISFHLNKAVKRITNSKKFKKSLFADFSLVKWLLRLFTAF